MALSLGILGLYWRSIRVCLYWLSAACAGNRSLRVRRVRQWFRRGATARQLLHRDARHQPAAVGHRAAACRKISSWLRRSLALGRRSATTTFWASRSWVWILLVIAVLLWYVLELKRLGRYLFATGGNLEAARLSGVKTDAMIWGAFVASGVV